MQLPPLPEICTWKVAAAIYFNYFLARKHERNVHRIAVSAIDLYYVYGYMHAWGRVRVIEYARLSKHNRLSRRSYFSYSFETDASPSP